MGQTFERPVHITPPGSLVEPSHRRRWPVLLAVLLVVTASALVSGMVYLARYQPLTSGNGGYSFTPTGTTKVKTRTTPSGDFWVIGPKEGDTLVLLFPLTNSGPVEVTIDDVEQPFNPQVRPGGQAHVWSTTRGQVSFATEHEANSLRSGPIRLRSGEAVQVRITFSILTCAKRANMASAASTRALPVHYRVLGVSHTAWVDLGHSFAIQGLPTCPDSFSIPAP